MYNIIKSRRIFNFHDVSLDLNDFGVVAVILFAFIFVIVFVRFERLIEFNDFEPTKYTTSRHLAENNNQKYVYRSTKRRK